MSWRFEVRAQSDLFYVTFTSPAPGDSFAFTVEGDPAGNGLVRVPNVLVQLAGESFATYADNREVNYVGFADEHPLYGRQTFPAGPAISRAGDGLQYMCITARGGRKLDYALVDAGRHVPATDPVYVIPTEDITVDGNPLPAFHIGRRTGRRPLNIIGNRTFIVWERA